MKRTEDMIALQRGMTLLAYECSTHKLCKACRLYFNNDCALNRPPAHWEVGEIMMHMHPSSFKEVDEKILTQKYELKN